MMSNTQYLPLGFTLIKPAHSTFNAFDSVHSTGDCAVGKIHGEQRNMHALVVENATDYADWTIVELSGKDSTGQMMFDSIAVYGAFDDMHAKIYATNTGAKLLGMFDSVAGDVVHSNQHGLQRALNTATGFNPKKPIPSWYIDKMQDVLSGEKVMWDSVTLKSHGGRLDNLLLDMQRHDDNCALVEQFDSVEQVLAQYDDIEIMAYDGVFMTYSQLEKFTKRLHLAMDNASKASKVQVKDVKVSDPFKRQGMAQIFVLYTLDDGQSVTVFLHNPDSTPTQMQANDVLIAWKWTLNGRDVTGAVQSTVHENGNTGANVNILAGRIMQLVDKNSARFKRTQAKREQQKQELELAQQRVTEKQGMLDKLNQDIMMLQEQLDNLVRNNQQTNNNQTSIDDDFKSGTIDKFILKVRVIGETGNDDTLVNMNEFLTLNEAQAFIQKLYGNESNLPQQDDRYDEIHLAIHYTDKDGNKHFEQRWTTLDIKTSDGFFNPFKQTIANYLFNDLVHLGIDPNMVQGQLADVQKEPIIELTGDEFGYSDDMPIDDLTQEPSQGTELQPEPTKENQEPTVEPQLIRSYDDKYVYTQDKQMRFYKNVNKFIVQKNDGVWGTVGRFDTMQELVKEYPQFTHHQQAVYENPLPDYDKSMFKLSEMDFDNNTFTLEIENSLVNSSQAGTNKMLSTGFAIRFGKDDETGNYQLIQLQLPETLSKDQAEVLEDYIFDKGYGDFIASDLQGAVDVVSQALLALQDKVTQLKDWINGEFAVPTNQNPNYTQSDIDYLNSVINKTIDLETVDMDKIIEIGEKDENDPLFEQALQVINDYTDEMTKDI